jgi:hypothetical protein
MRNNGLPSADAGVDHGCAPGQSMNASSAQIERNQRACNSASRGTCSGRGAVAMSQLARQGAPNRAANHVGVR